MKENLDLCPCQISAKHDPDYKPIACGCLGVDPLYRECNGDYAEYSKNKYERSLEQVNNLKEKLENE